MRLPGNINRILLGIVLSLIIIMSPLYQAASADAAVTVSVYPLTSSVAAGGDFWVYLNVTQVTNLQFYRFDVTYDPGVIQVVGTEGGVGVASGLIGTTVLPVTGWNFQPNPGTPSGTIRVPLQNLGSGVSGTGYLGKIHFTVVGSGGQSTSITIPPANIVLNDGNTNPIPVGTPISGSLSIPYPPVVVSISTPAAVSSGDTFTARVNISQVFNLSAYQIIVAYDPAVLQLDPIDEFGPGVTGGIVGPTAMPLDNWGYYPVGIPGTIIAVGHLASAGQTSGTGYLDDLHFQAVGAQGTQSAIMFTTVPTGYSKLFDNTGTMKTNVTWMGTSVSIISAYRITNSSLAPGEVGRPYSQTLGATGGTPPYTFSIASGSLPHNLTLAPGGLISGTPDIAGGASVTFRVTDNTTSSATRTLPLTIVSQPVVTTSSPLPSGTASALYNQVLSVAGGVGPYTWTAAPGSLPAGLSLSSAGVISGTPTVAGGPTVFNVNVSDSLGGSGSASLSLTILSGPVITSGPSLPDGEVNAYYTQTLNVTGGTAPYTWNALGTLPAGLSLSLAGVISGTPTAAGGPTTFNVQVTDHAGAFYNASLSITIAANPSITTGSTLPNGEVGAAYSRTLAVTGGLAPFIWTKTTGNWPAGLTMSIAGVISGTPTTASGATSVTVMVTDNAGKTNTRIFSITVISGVVITTGAVSNGQIGLAYSQTLATSGGQSPFTWALQSGSLPDGLSLSTAGVISGTPTTLGGPTSFVVRVTDSLVGVATAGYAITIVNGPVIMTTSPLPNGEVNIAYSQTLTVSGGVGPYTWSKTSGTWPAGLALSSSGVISGTPTTAGGPVTVTVKVTDSNNSIATRDLNLTIATAPVITPSGTLPGGEVSLPYSQTLTVSGGVGPYVWSKTSGNWPAGLTLSASGVIFGTPTAAGGPTSATVRVTDSLNAYASAGVAITIAVGPTITTGSTLTGGETTAPYSLTLAGTGGITPYSWQVVSGNLPAGLSLSYTGVISGTPTAVGTASFSIKLTDNAGGNMTSAFTLNIASGPVIATSSPLRNAEVNYLYSQSLTVTGGSGGNTWTKLSGTLPSGVNFTPAGVFYGTPTAAGGPYSATVKVTDSAGGYASGVFTFSVVNGPSTASGALPNGEVNLPYSQILTVSGGVSPYTWSKTSGSWPAGLSLSTAGVVSGTPTTAGGPISATVRVTDSYGSSNTASVTITIVTAPGITTLALPNGEVTAPYYQTLTVSGGVSPYSWSVPPGSLPAGLSLSSAGVISGVPTAAGGPTAFTVSVSDNMGGVGTKNLTLTIASPPVITTASPLPNGEVSVAYSKTLAVSGGVSPYIWSVPPGSLPAGLSLSAAGVISGTPTAAGGPLTVTVTVTDGLGGHASTDLALTIAAAPSITTASALPNAEVSLPYSQTLTVSGGVSPYTWSLFSGTLPGGLNLTADGLITGSPTTAGGPVSFTVKVLDNAGVQATKPFSLTVVSAPSITTASPLSPGEVGIAYTVTLTVSGGVGPYSWSVPPGSLPAGLSLSSAGVISGVPTAAGGPTAFTVSVSDNMGGVGTKNLTLTIASPPVITTASPLPNGEVSAAYSKTLAVSGGVSPYIWSVPPGSLPAGLSLSAAGVISGTPTAAGGPLTVTVTVTDGLGGHASTDLTLTIAAAPSITTASALPNAEVSLPYSQTLTVNGGVGPYVWSLFSGTLPGGLNLTAAGLITGSPTTAGGPVSFTVKVVDNAGVQATKPFSLTVVSAPSITTASPLSTGEVGIAYTVTLTVSGGVGPYSWSVPPGSLPAGLSLSSAGVISGVPTAAGGPTAFTVSVTDNMGGVGTKNLSLTIASPPVITTASPLPSGEVSVAYSKTLAVSGGVSPYVWSVPPGSLPAGLSLSAAGVISGTPAAAGGPLTVTVTVTDGLGGHASTDLTLTIAAAPSITTAGALPNAEVSLPYSQTLTVNGGVGPYVWSLFSGTLPGGLNLTAAGLITGSPTTAGGPVSFTVKVLDNAGAQATQPFTLTVVSAPSITTASPLSTGEVGIAYTVTLAAAGGTQGYIWSAMGLPDGLIISTAGVISGVPTATGDFSVNVTVNDSYSTPGTANKTFALHIYNTLQISNASLAEVLQGKPYNQSLAASGGNAVYTWDATGLPAGLTIATGGFISGTPSVSGNFRVNLILKDSLSGASSVTKTLTLKVYMPYDVNGNGVVDMGDAVCQERIILGLNPITPAADANGDGKTDVNDIVKIEKVILGIDQ